MTKFYKCDVCGKIVAVIDDNAATMTCCGQDMTLLVPGITDGAKEKHVPVYTWDKDRISVQVGSDPHPMADNHYIKFIALETDNGLYIRKLKPNNKPIAEFKLCCHEKAKTIYEYCNLHGLWKSDVTCC